MDSKLSEKGKQDLIFAAVLAAVFVLQIWKSFQGMGPIDEHFYLTLGYRLVKGDALIYDEWHISQMISLFIAPVLRVYIACTGGTDGLVHFFRIVYVVLNSFCGIALYLRFRSRGFAAVLSSLAYMSFVPFHIMALSYNTMSIAFLLLSLCAFDGKSRGRTFLAGILYAFAVLNTPYLALLYFLFSAVVMMKKDSEKKRHLPVFTAGIVLPAFLTLLVLFKGASFGQLLEGLPHLFDKGHADAAPWLLVKGAGKLFQAFSVFFPLMLAELPAAWFVHAKHPEKDGILLKAALLVQLLSSVYIIIVRPYYPDLGGHALLLFPFALCGMLLFVQNPEYRKSEEAFFFAVSVLHALLVAVSSNVGPRSFCSMLITACAVTVPLLFQTRIGLPWRCLTSFIFCGLLFFTRITGLYDAEGPLDAKIKEGPLAGLKDTEKNVSEYAMMLEDVRYINSLPEENAAFITYSAWTYLASEKGVAASSAYINPGFEEEWRGNQNAYRIMHPEKFPSLVYLDTADPPYGMKGTDPYFRTMDYLGPLNRGTLFLEK